MAKKVTKKATKKVAKKEEVEVADLPTEEVEGKRTALSEVEMLVLDLHTFKVKNKEIEIVVLSQKKQLLEREIERELLRKQGELSLLKEKRSKFNEELRRVFNIETEKWGYDPITGEIKDGREVFSS